MEASWGEGTAAPHSSFGPNGALTRSRELTRTCAFLNVETSVPTAFQSVTVVSVRYHAGDHTTISWRWSSRSSRGRETPRILHARRLLLPHSRSTRSM